MNEIAPISCMANLPTVRAVLLHGLSRFWGLNSLLVNNLFSSLHPGSEKAMNSLPYLQNGFRDD